jgi:hypothetical protein
VLDAGPGAGAPVALEAPRHVCPILAIGDRAGDLAVRANIALHLEAFGARVTGLAVLDLHRVTIGLLAVPVLRHDQDAPASIELPHLLSGRRMRQEGKAGGAGKAKEGDEPHGRISGTGALAPGRWSWIDIGSGARCAQEGRRVTLPSRRGSAPAASVPCAGEAQNESRRIGDAAA